MENSSSNPPTTVRVIARIRGFTNRERELAKSSLKPWISIKKPEGESSEAVTLSFGDQYSSQKDSCTVHYCYDHDEDTDMIYTREIKPLVSGVFDGHDATVVAHGAIASGKTYTIQGSEQKPGLAILAMDEIISTAEMLGKSVMISMYEIYQEHAYDLLNPSRPAIMVMEDAQGRIQLKGLSQAPMKSVSEFRKTHLTVSRTQRAVQKPQTELSQRSHKGLIVHLVTPNNNSGASHVGKMNFIDLAGYEDSRRKTSDSARILENNLLNRSLYALQKVVLALTANESHVPFRESKLTRLLQDSLGGKNRLLFVACLNPSFCQDSIYMANLAFRTFQGLHQSIMGSTKKTKSSNRIAAFSSGKGRTPLSVSATMRKQTGSRIHFLQKKISGTPVLEGKKLFDEVSCSKKPIKATSTPSVASAAETETHDEPTFTVTAPPVAITLPLEEEKSSVDSAKETLSLEEENHPSVTLYEVSQDTYQKSMENLVDLSSDANCTLEAFSLNKEDDSTDMEKSRPSIDMGRSPPLFARLREISNNLKLVDSTPTCIELPKQKNLPCEGQVSAEPEDFEPRTPIFEYTQENEKLCLNTPQEVSKTCYLGSKNSLVQEYLRFVNSASKEELKGLKGIGEKRATYILKLREESPEPFKSLDDLKGIGLSAKQIKGMLAMK